ncbi:hypothetical protein [Pseudofrankia sp. DC12]|uniref:ATP-grasp domain-containing protein n=1 Tax=Pseudofrankia sp. DC12 TaxID=683315 RepID=UPI000AB0AAF8|nr:hypothetical protein [Pseudofrankia sp. DC12]
MTGTHAPVVLLLAQAHDRDAAAVAEHLPASRTLWLDDDWLRRGDGLRWHLDRTGLGGLVLAGRTLRPAEVGSVLVRPAVHDGPDGLLTEYLLLPPPGLDDAHLEVARREAAAALLGALSSGPARWVNAPAVESAAGYTLHQLALAAEFGLAVPATIVTDDGAALTAFLADHGGEAVTKAVDSASARRMPVTLATRRFQEPDLRALADAPPRVTLLQELVPAAYDIRVTLIGDETFACSVDNPPGDGPLDWRLDTSLRPRPCPLDDHVVESLQRMRRRLGLAYATADLRMTLGGTAVFLDLDPRGAFAFVEERTGLPLAAALAALLLLYASR